MPPFDSQREKAGVPPLALDLQPNRNGIIGLGVMLGKVADPTLAGFLAGYSFERLKILVIKDSAAFKKLRGSLGEQLAFVLQQNEHRFAAQETLTPEGFVKFAVCFLNDCQCEWLAHQFVL